MHTTGYLQIERRLAEGGGNDTNLYNFSGLFDAIRAQLVPRTDAMSSEQDSSTEPDAVLAEEPSAPEPGVPPALSRHRRKQPKYARTTSPNTVK